QPAFRDLSWSRCARGRSTSFGKPERPPVGARFPARDPVLPADLRERECRHALTTLLLTHQNGRKRCGDAIERPSPSRATITYTSDGFGLGGNTECRSRLSKLQP